MPLRRQLGGYTGKMVQSVLGRFEGQRTPNHVMLNESLYTAQRKFPPGLWCGWNPATSKYVFLPRAKAIAVAGNVVTLSPYLAGVFTVGQSLAVLNPDGTPTATTATVTAINPTANQITLSAPVPVNSNIGDPTVISTKPNGDKLGVLSPNLPIDLDQNYYLGVHAGGTFYRGLMPYIDGELESKYPLIMYV